MRLRIWLPVMVAATVAAVGVLAQWPAARAGHVVVRDPQDADGPLDVRRADALGERRPRFKIATHGSWRTRAIWDTGFLLVWIDSFGDDRFDYYALIRARGSRLRADLFRDRRRKSDRRVASLSVWRKNRRSVSVRVPLSKLRIGDARVHYGWAVQTLYTGAGCRRTCFDRAPDAGDVKELLPGIEPSPTPTSTPTPSITDL